MDMIIAIIVLAIAVTVNFMSFVNLKNRIEAARKSIEYLIEIKANRTSKDIALETDVVVQDINLLSEKIDRTKDEINKIAKHNTNEIIYRTVKGRRR